MAQGYVRPSDLPQIVPLFPLAGAILLPRGQLPLNIFEPRYLNMVDDAMSGERIIAMIQPAGPPLESSGPEPEPEPDPVLTSVGCAGRITRYDETSDGRYLITLTGLCRFRLLSELDVHAPYRQARVDFAPFGDDLKAVTETPFEREALLDALRAYLVPRGFEIDWRAAGEAPVEALVSSLSMALPFDPSGKQALLEAPDLAARLDCLTALLRIEAAEPDDGDPAPMQ